MKQAIASMSSVDVRIMLFLLSVPQRYGAITPNLIYIVGHAGRCNGFVSLQHTGGSE